MQVPPTSHPRQAHPRPGLALCLGPHVSPNAASALTQDSELRKDGVLGVEVSSVRGVVKREDGMGTGCTRGRDFSEPKR